MSLDAEDMFRKLFAKSAPKRLTDVVFGELQFAGTSKPYWEGSGIFPATKDSVEYFIDAAENGPGSTQREFFERLNQGWANVIADVAPILHKGWRETHRSEPPDASRFQVTSLSIPERDSEESDWHIAFQSPDDPQKWLFTVYMRGWKPTGATNIER